LKTILKVCFTTDHNNRILFGYNLELDQEEKDRRKQEITAGRPMEDDPIESEDTIQVSNINHSLV
jgi:hypothetical protein